MCADVWAARGRFLSEEAASASGTLDSFPSEPRARCGESLAKSKYATVYIVTSGCGGPFYNLCILYLLIQSSYLHLALGHVFGTSVADLSAFG